MFLLPIVSVIWKNLWWYYLGWVGRLSFQYIKHLKKIVKTSVLLSLKEKQEEQLLTALPPPTPSQIKAIGVAIENVVQEFGLNSEDLEERLNIKTMMENLLRQKLPGIVCNLF